MKVSKKKSRQHFNQTHSNKVIEINKIIIQKKLMPMR